MKHIALLVVTLACMSCPGIPRKVEDQGSIKAKPKPKEITIELDAFYPSESHPDIKLRGHEVTELRSIIEAAPDAAPESYPEVPRNATISPPEGMCIINDGDTVYFLMRDCKILRLEIPLEGRLKIYRILSKHTSYFEKPN